MSIDARTKLYLLLGKPVDHSLSPLMHNAAFTALGINSVYLACSVEKGRVGAALDGMRALSAGGANVTAPYKEDVMPHLDTVSPEAARIRSVNTIVNRSGQLHGTTTDGEGFYRFLKKTDPAYSTGHSILIIGAGGAARAVAYTLAEKGAEEIIIANRSASRGLALKELLSEISALKRCTVITLEDKPIGEVLGRCRLVVYTLPFDTPEFSAALSGIDRLEKNQMLIDLRYQPEKSEIMQAFRRQGGCAHNGLGMLVWQAVKSFALFTGQKAPVEIMQKAAGSKDPEPPG